MERKTQVVLVDSADRQTGLAEKLDAHEKGLLHRAVSVFLFNESGAMLLQKRAVGKYHSAGLWSNTCCTHPYPGEPALEAAGRRLKEELGISCSIVRFGSVIYKAPVGNGLIEHELDHLFVGRYGGEVEPEPTEVSSTRFVDLKELEEALVFREAEYSTWFKLLYPELKKMADIDSYLRVMGSLSLPG